MVFLGTGEHLQEAQSTNASLSALGDVVYALSKGNDFILYRNSTLTIIGTLSKDDERRGRGRTGSNFERKHVSALADVTRRLPNVENVEKLVLTFCVVRKYSFKYFFSFYMFYPAKTM